MPQMKAVFSDRRQAVPAGKRVGAWLLKGVAGALCFVQWFSYSGYGLLIDLAMYATAALMVWLAWIVEGKP